MLPPFQDSTLKYNFKNITVHLEELIRFSSLVSWKKKTYKVYKDDSIK